MAAEVRYEVSGGVAIVTINRPEKRNALNLAACETLQDCWRRIENDPGVRVGIVTGAGDKAFCAGFDITEKNVDGRPRTEDFTPRLGTRPGDRQAAHRGGERTGHGCGHGPGRGV